MRESIGRLTHTIHVGRHRCYGRIFDQNIALLEAGVGAVNTAHALTSVLDSKPPVCVVQVGIGGAYPDSGLSVGDIAIATEEVYGDLGIVLPNRYAFADEIGIPIVPGDTPRFNVMPVDDQLSEAAAAAADRVAAETGCRAKAGRFLTLQQCTGCSTLAAELEQRFGAICENMEGAAAAHVCALYRIPFFEIRGISNIVEDRDTSKWDIPTASSRAQAAILNFFKSL